MDTASTTSGPQFVGEIGVRGELHVTVDKPEYCAGDSVTGRLTVAVSETIHCDTLSFAISGEEIAQWTERGDHHSRYQEFLQHEILRVVLPTPCPPGEYLYPFQYTLPADAPGVLDADSLYGDAKALHATIRYTLKASIKVEGRFISDLEATHALVVREKQQQQQQQPSAAIPSNGGVERTVSKRVRMLGCISRGTCHVAASMKSNELALGETARVDIFVNNHTSAVSIRSVKCRLYQDVTLHDPVEGERICSRPLLQVKCDGPRSGELLERPIDLVLAGKLRYPSTRGRFLACSYRIALECEMLLAKSIQIYLPVKILPPRGPLRPMNARLPAVLLAQSPPPPLVSSAYTATLHGTQEPLPPASTPTGATATTAASVVPQEGSTAAAPISTQPFGHLVAAPPLPTIDLLA